MPTKEERREIAAIMRDVTSTYVSSCTLSNYLGIDCTKYEDCAECKKELASRLADLIEPEPERTCKWTHIEGTWFLSECGRRYGRVIPGNYCPNCGLRVISD